MVTGAADVVGLVGTVLTTGVAGEVVGVGRHDHVPESGSDGEGVIAVDVDGATDASVNASGWSSTVLRVEEPAVVEATSEVEVASAGSSGSLTDSPLAASPIDDVAEISASTSGNASPTSTSAQLAVTANAPTARAALRIRRNLLTTALPPAGNRRVSHHAVHRRSRRSDHPEFLGH